MLPADRVLSFEGKAYVVTYLDEGKTLGALCEDGTLRLWDAQSGTAQPSRSTPVSRRPVGRVGSGNRLAGLDKSGAVQVWDLGHATKTSELPSAITGRADEVAVSHDGALVATAHIPNAQTSENVIHVRDASGKEVFRVPAGIGGTAALAFAPDGSTLVAATWDADVRVWSARNGELIKVVDALPVAMFALSFSPDGKWLAMAGVDRTVYLWNTRTWKLEKKLTGQKEIIAALAFSPDGRRLVTGGFDSAAMAKPVQLIVWDVAGGKALRTEAMPHAVTGVVFSPDGRQVAALSSGDTAVRVWAVPVD